MAEIRSPKLENDRKRPARHIAVQNPPSGGLGPIGYCSIRTGFGFRVSCIGFFLLAFFTSPAFEVLAADPQGMSVVRSKYYRIQTDLDRELAEGLAQRMDSMFAEYQRRLSNFGGKASAPLMQAYLFRHRDDYLRLTGDRWRNSGGVFMASRNLLAAFHEGQGRDALRRTLQHEAFHQFAHLAIGPNIPIWLNEGMAQLFEEGIWTGDTFLLGQAPPRRIRQLQADIENRKLIPFDRLMALTPDEWSRVLADDRDGAGATQYNQSWAMVHFLVQAQDSDGREKYRGRLIQMLQLLHEGRDGQAAFEAAFSSNVKGFQNRFVEYARELAPTHEATLIERQEVLADILIELKNHGRTFDRVADLRDAAVAGKFVLTYRDREMTWSTDPDVAVYFSDIAGQPFSERELFFSRRAGAPLPDIVCRASDRLMLRTRFHPTSGEKLEHEVLVESPRFQARVQD